MARKKITIKEYDNLIKNHIDKRNFVKVERTVANGESNVFGFILQMSKDFLLIQAGEEFSFNGYAIIRKDHFDGIRCNKFDKTCKKILKAEGIFGAEYGIRNKLRLRDWQTIFEDLIKYDYHIIVECEDLADPLFVIGPIKKVRNDSVSIQYYDPTGLLDKTPTVVKYKDITSVSFDTRYINVFRKYLRTK